MVGVRIKISTAPTFQAILHWQEACDCLPVFFRAGSQVGFLRIAVDDKILLVAMLCLQPIRTNRAGAGESPGPSVHFDGAGPSPRGDKQQALWKTTALARERLGRHA